MNNEEEKPLEEQKEYETEPVKPKDLIGYTLKMKGHELMNMIVFILLIIFLFDFFGNNKKSLKDIIEVLKTLLFTLCGYLFGKNEQE